MTFLTEDNSTSNVIFIDTNLSNYTSLVPDTNDSSIVFIDSQGNGIQQISEALENYSNLDTISIFSHGDVGLLQLGDTYLSNDNLDSYQDELAAWGDALSATGDMILYGCNVAGDLQGLDFVERIADLTGADVAASNDLTGNATLGGDWVLEVATGSIETPTFEINEFGGVLRGRKTKKTSQSDSNADSLQSDSNADSLQLNSTYDLKFNFTYDLGVTTEQKTAFEMAGKMWSNLLNDNATINVHISMVNSADMPDNVLGGAVPFFTVENNYGDVRNSMIDDATTRDDNTAVNTLEADTTWYTAVNADGGNSSTFMRSSHLALTRANAKALNIIDSNSQTLDGLIVMNDLSNTGLGWNYNYTSDSVQSNQFDFTSVAMHEIGHLLGFVSSMDAHSLENIDNQDFLGKAATSFDLFRYVGASGGDYYMRDLRGGMGNFSIDGRNTLAEMSTGQDAERLAVYSVDGYQTSHWKHGYNVGLMDPVAGLGQKSNIEELDLKAVDVIGWDRVVGAKSVDTLYTEALNIAQNKGNINRNVEVDQMLADWRWARRGSQTRLAQEGNIVQFLAQEGFFSVGAFRNSFDFSTVNSVEDPNLPVTIDLMFEAQEFQTNSGNDSDLDTSFELISEINPSLVVETQPQDVEQIVALVTEGLSEDRLSQLSLEDLAQLIEQQLEESLINN